MAPRSCIIKQDLSPALIETVQLEPPADPLNRAIPEVFVGGVKRTPTAHGESPHTPMLLGAKARGSSVIECCHGMVIRLGFSINRHWIVIII